MLTIANIAKMMSEEYAFPKTIKDAVDLLATELLKSNCLLLLFKDNMKHVFYKAKSVSEVLDRGIDFSHSSVDDNKLIEILSRNIAQDNEYNWHAGVLRVVINNYKTAGYESQDNELLWIDFSKERVGVFVYPSPPNATDPGTIRKNSQFVKNMLSIVVAPEFICDRERANIKDDIAKFLIKESDQGDLSTFYYRLIDACKRAFESEEASLYLQTPDGKELKAVAGVGQSETWIDDISYSKTDEKGVTLHVWNTSKPFRWSRVAGMDLPQELSEIALSKGEMKNCWSLLAVPVSDGQKCVGVLKVEKKGVKETPKAFTLSDQRNIETITQVVTSRLAGKDKLFDTIAFGREFFLALSETCSDEKKRAKKRGGDYSNNICDFVGKIAKFAEVLKQSKCTSREELFKYVEQFNKGAYRIITGSASDDENSVFQNLAKIENVLYEIPKYRDHMIHQAQVFLIGFLILAKITNQDASDIWELEPTKIGFEDGSWLKRWFLASSFHDIGYSFENIEQWPELLFNQMINDTNSENERHRSLLNWGTLLAKGEIGAHFDLLLSHIYKTFQVEKDVEKTKVRQALLSKTVVDPCHSTIGALLFLDKMGFCKQVKKPAARIMSEDILKDAAVAICLHASEVADALLKAMDRETRLLFKEAPFALLLAFCDVVHEWGRDKPGQISKGTKIQENPEFIGIDYSANTITINMSYYSDTVNEEKFNKIYDKYLKKVVDCWGAGGKFFIKYYSKYDKDKADNKPFPRQVEI